MRRALVAAACVAFACLAGAVGLTYDEARVLSDRDEEGLPKDRFEALVAAQGELIGNAVLACMHLREQPDKVRLGVIMELGEQGRVVRTWRRDDDALTACFERRSANATIVAPPYTPFYTGIELDLDVTVED